jgi:predicted dehydrogenase
VTRQLGVGIVGYGGMGRAHARAYRLAPQLRPLPVNPCVRAISGRHRAGVEHAATAWGIDSWTTDWRELVERPDLQLISVCTPPGTHAAIVEAAAAAGKAVLCEKPLTAELGDARAAVHAVRGAGVLNAIGFNYRRLPALALMKRMLDDGRIGDVRLFRATWLTDEFSSPDMPFDWRFQRSLGGSTTADLGSHVIDLALWMAGGVAEVSGQSACFTPHRLDPETGQPREVDVEDATSALLRFESGARGTVELARIAPRRPCDLTVELTGSRGTLLFDYARMNELWFGDGDGDPGVYGLHRIRVEHPDHPYAGDGWPIGQGIGYGQTFASQVADHLERWPDGPWHPDLAQGLQVQRVCEAIERSAAQRRWVAVSEIEPA